jgi:hypothetical protein
LIGKLVAAVLAVAVAVFPLTVAQARMPSPHAGEHHAHGTGYAAIKQAHGHHAHHGIAADAVAPDMAVAADTTAKGEPHHDKGCCVACHAIDALTLASIEPPCAAHALLHLAGDPQLPGEPPSGIERPPRPH